MEDIAYRGEARVDVPTEKPQSVDERDLPTLVQVRDLMHEYLDQMASNFNAFDSTLSPEQLYVQVKARQEAHALIEPLYQAIVTVVDKIHQQNRG